MPATDLSAGSVTTEILCCSHVVALRQNATLLTAEA